MEYIIKTADKGYFCGWNMFGDMKFVKEKRLAYRMRKPVAENTAKKIGEKEKSEILLAG